MPTSNIIAAVEPGSVAQRAGLKPGDRILQIDDKPVFTVQDIQELIRDSQGKRLRLTIQRAQRLHTLYLTPEIETVYELPMDTRLLEARVGKIIEFFPAGGVLQRGDLIKKVNGTKISCWKDLKDAITKLAGKDARLQIDRGGQILNLKVRVAKIGREGKGMLGIEAMPSKVFALVKEGLYYTQGLRSGDILRAIDGTIGDIYVSDLFGRLRLTREPSSVKLEVLRGQEVIPIELPRQLCTYGKPIGIVLEIDRFYRYWGLKEAIIEGLLEPIELSMLTFQFIYKLFAREESPKMLAGPIGIVHISVRAAEAGLGTFLWLLALITISLGILNLLPIPALDGGFILLLLFETIKGKPLSQRFASGFVTLGWILVLMLLVYVCYNDILRLFSRTF
jgi:membrane-associated protease RseP (regulator of RpoE activity)